MRIFLSLYAVAVTLALLATLILDGPGAPGPRFRALFQKEVGTTPIRIHGRFLSRQQLNELIPDSAVVLPGYTPLPVYVLATSTPATIDGRTVVHVSAEVTNEELSGHRTVHFGIDNYDLRGLQLRDPNELNRVLASTPQFRVTAVAVK